MKGGEAFENAKIQASQSRQMYCSRTIHCNAQCQEQASQQGGQGQKSNVISLFQLTEGFISQAHDRIKADKGGGYSQKKVPPRDLGHTTAS